MDRQNDLKVGATASYAHVLAKQSQSDAPHVLTSPVSAVFLSPPSTSTPDLLRPFSRNQTSDINISIRPNPITSPNPRNPRLLLSSGGEAAMAYTRALSFSADRAPTSPPASPMRGSPMRRTTPLASSSLGKGLVGGGGRVRSLPRRIAWMLLSLLLRRQAIFLFAPLVYISGMLFYMGTVSLDVVPQIIKRPMPGSVYRSPHLYERFRKDLEADNSSDHSLTAVWRYPYRGGEWKPCTKASLDGMNYKLSEDSFSLIVMSYASPILKSTTKSYFFMVDLSIWVLVE